jgi:hypothetical protein
MTVTVGEIKLHHGAAQLKPDSPLPAQLTTFKAHQENPESGDW